MKASICGLFALAGTGLATWGSYGDQDSCDGSSNSYKDAHHKSRSTDCASASASSRHVSKGASSQQPIYITTTLTTSVCPESSGHASHPASSHSASVVITFPASSAQPTTAKASSVQPVTSRLSTAPAATTTKSVGTTSLTTTASATTTQLPVTAAAVPNGQAGAGAAFAAAALVAALI